jgi:hypothetical protein
MKVKVLGTVFATAVAVSFSMTDVASGSINLVGLDFSTAGDPNIPMNWNRVSAAQGTISNLMDETGATTNVGVNFGGGPSGGFVYLSTSTLAPDAVPQYDYDLSGMTGYGFRSDGEFFVEFTGLNPNSAYEFWFVGYRATIAIQNVVTVTDGDANDFTFVQSLSADDNDGRFMVNTINANNTMQWNDLSLVTMSDSDGMIRFDWFGDGQTTVIGALAIRAVAVPAPGALAMLVLAPIALGSRRRRRQ